MLRASSLLLLTLWWPAAGAAQTPPEPPGPQAAGTWVEAGLRHALKDDRQEPLSCFLEVGEDQTAVERCPWALVNWGTGVPSDKRPGAVTLTFAGEPPRELVHRGGTPEELELIEGSPEGQRYRRLYRLPALLVPRLAEWLAEERARPASAVAPPAPAAKPGPATPPPLARPLEPRPRCGCAASDAGAPAVAVAFLALAARRKQAAPR